MPGSRAPAPRKPPVTVVMDRKGQRALARTREALVDAGLLERHEGRGGPVYLRTAASTLAGGRLPQRLDQVLALAVATVEGIRQGHDPAPPPMPKRARRPLTTHPRPPSTRAS